LAVIVTVEEVFVASGVTVSQLAEVLVVNETASAGGAVVKVICCDTGVVEPTGTAVGVHEVRLGVTVGGAVPVAMIVALVRLNVLVGSVPPP
jgi:hypothetical protein